LAVGVTVVLLLPDFYTLYRGQPATAVAVLMAMQLAIALVPITCWFIRRPSARPRHQADTGLQVTSQTDAR
jgi:hypothetical protein